METIFECILELILEGSFELGTNKKVPMAIRIIAIILLFVFYLGITGLIVLLAVDLLNEGSTAGAICFFVLAAFFFIGVIWAIRKKYRENNKN